jgi:hypothetical protein
MARDEQGCRAYAAKAHRSAAEHHGKGDHTTGKEHANVAKQHSPPTSIPTKLIQKASSRNN